MQQGGVACKARGIIPFSFHFCAHIQFALFFCLINVLGEHIGSPLRYMRFYLLCSFVRTYVATPDCRHCRARS